MNNTQNDMMTSMWPTDGWQHFTWICGDEGDWMLRNDGENEASKEKMR